MRPPAPELAVGRIPKWPTGADCKSAGSRLRWFESISYHQLLAEPEAAILAFVCNHSIEIAFVGSAGSEDAQQGLDLSEFRWPDAADICQFVDALVRTAVDNGVCGAECQLPSS